MQKRSKMEAALSFFLRESEAIETSRMKITKSFVIKIKLRGERSELDKIFVIK